MPKQKISSASFARMQTNVSSLSSRSPAGQRERESIMTSKRMRIAWSDVLVGSSKNHRQKQENHEDDTF